MTDILVLCYHAVSEDWESELAVTPAALEWQLALLLRRGFRGTTFHEAVSSPPAPRTLAVTFDDAYGSVLELASPVLSRLGVPGSVFVPTDFVGSDGPMSWPGIDHWLGGRHRSELMCMSWDQLERLAAAGWEIGSHTRSHPRLSQLDDDTLAEELSGSRSACEEALRRPCLSLAYPYGDFDDRVVSAAATAGYRAAGTLPAPFHAPLPLRWPRVGVYREDGPLRFRLKVSAPGRRLRALAG